MSDRKVMRERDMQQLSSQQTVGKFLFKLLVYVFLILMAVIVLFPFYWMIISSLKSLPEYRLSIPTFWPKQIMFSNYAEAFTTANLGRLFLNTLYVGVISTVLSLIITVLSAIAFARLEFKASPLLVLGLYGCPRLSASCEIRDFFSSSVMMSICSAARAHCSS